MPGFPVRDRWLAAWGAGYAAVGAASLLVPLYAISLGAGPFLVGLVAATAALAGVPGALLWGRLAETTGRHRSFVLVSLLLSALALAAIPTVASLTFVLAANAVLWFAVSAAAPVLTLMVVTGVSEHEWDQRIGVLNTWQGYGWLAGLLAGAAWNAVGVRFLSPVDAQQTFFYVLAAVAFLAFAAGYRLFPGTDVTVAEFGRSRRAVDRLVRGAGRRVGLDPISPIRVFWSVRKLHPRHLVGNLPSALAGYLAAVFLAFTGFAVFFGPLPAYLAAEAGLRTGEVFAVFLASSAASAVFYSRAGAMASRRGPYVPQFGALGARVLIFPLVAAVGLLPAGEFPFLLALFAGVGATWAIIAVTAAGIVTRLAPTNLRGDALGAYTALGGIATAVGSLTGGALAGRLGYVVAFAAAGTLVLLGLLVAYGQYRRRQQATPAT